MKNSAAYNTRRITYSAILIAITIVLLYISAIIPYAKLSVIAIAGLIPAIIVIEFGAATAFAAYFAASVLALVLLPEKSSAIIYVLVFGHYPIIKSLIEKINKQWIEWIIKLAVLNLLIFITYNLFSSAFIKIIPKSITVLYAVYISGNIAFIIYDIAFTKLIYFYNSRILKHIK